MNYERKFIQHHVTRPALRPNVGANYALKEVRAVVCHYTANANKGADANAHFLYFNNGAPDKKGVPRAASAHIFVDDKRVLQIIPFSEIAFHVGDKNFNGRYKPLCYRLMTPFLTANYCTVGYEICINQGADFTETINTAADVAAWMLFIHGLSIKDHVRHFDLTGKKCPLFFLDEEKWRLFNADVSARLDNLRNLYTVAAVASKELNVRAGAGTKHSVLYALCQGEMVMLLKDKAQYINGWAQIHAGQWINTKFVDFS